MSSIVLLGKEYYGDFYNIDSYLEAQDGDEDYWQWPGDFSKGHLYIVKLRPGLLLTIMEHECRIPVSVSFKTGSACIVVAYVLSGGTSIQSNRKLSNKIDNHSQSFLAYTPRCEGTVNFPTRTTTRIVGIYIEPWLVSDFFGINNANVSNIVNKTTTGDDFHFAFSLSPIIEQKLCEILDCPYRGKLKKVFFEGKALELIAHCFSEVMVGGQTGIEGCSYSPHAPDFVCEARNILVENIQSPPSLSNLSRQVGVSKNKLSSSFRTAYGTSVYDYLRTYRLEKSKELLATGTKNVTEVAFEVGYAQQGNFTREFKKHFNISPREYNTLS